MAAAPSSLGTQFREELACSICHELFTRPKMLSCQHTFCQDCLQRVLGKKRIFKCPVCGRKGRLPRHGVAGLPDSLSVANMSDEFQQDMIPSEEAREHQPKKVTFGGRGSEAGQFILPYGVTVSDEGDIFIADYVNKRIQVFTLQRTFVHQFPTVVSGEQKMDPWDVATDAEGNLWVVGRTDSANFAVQYNTQGRVLKIIELQFTRWFRGVDVDTRRNHILVTQSKGEWPNPRCGEVLVFRPDGTLVRVLGQEQGMKYPLYITVDGEGNMLVSDCVNHFIHAYNKDGQFLFQFGGEGSGEGQLKYPHGICADRAGNIIVADMYNHRVELFDKTGRFLKHIITDMEDPFAVAMAPQKQLVVTDGSNTVSIYLNY